MKSKYLLLLGIGIGALVTVNLYPSQRTNNKFDAFAQCLAEKRITMYGAEWCSHCQNEKKAFGDAFKFVPYVECPADPQKCLASGIDGYPTWILPDGKKLEGEQGLVRLSGESGCPLPAN